MSNTLFISWTDHGRSAGLADALGAANVVIPGDKRSNLAVRYVQQFSHTVNTLRQAQPSGVIFMQPPAPLQLAVSMTMRGRGAIVGDLHSGYFNDSKWSWFTRIGLRALRRHAIIVTNSRMAATAERSGVAKVFVLHDVLEKQYFDDPTSRVRADCVLVPLSYASDEPVDAILLAAARVPEITWSLTGRAPQAVREIAPPNVEFTGFVSDGEFRERMLRARAVLALTDRSDTMQRAGYEGMMHGTPVVTSDHDVLRDFFGDSAVYVRSTPESIARAVRSVSTGTAIPALIETLETRIDEQSATLRDLASYLRMAENV